MSLRRNTAYRWLWISYTLSLTGTWASVVCLPLLILDVFRSPALVGLVSFAAAATLLLVMPWTGLVVDRMGWRTVMVGSDLLRAATLGLLTVAIASEEISLPLVLAVTVINSALSVPFLSAIGAALRASVRSAQLPAALALNQGRTAVIGVLGPVAGAGLYDVSRALPFAVDTATFLLSALCLGMVRGTAVDPEETKPALRWQDISAGWRFVRHHSVLRNLTLNIVVTDFSINGVMLVFVVLAAGEGDATAVGLMTAASGIGNLLGSAAAVPVLRWARPRTLLTLSALLTAGSAPVIAARGTVVWCLVVVACGCVAPPVVAVLTNTTVLEDTPVHLIGRVLSIFQTLPRLVAASGPPCAGVLLTFLPAQSVLLLFALPLLALAGHTMTTPTLRATRE